MQQIVRQHALTAMLLIFKGLPGSDEPPFDNRDRTLLFSFTDQRRVGKYSVVLRQCSMSDVGMLEQWRFSSADEMLKEFLANAEQYVERPDAIF